MAARHRAFIGSRIVLGFTALASFPVYLVFNGVPGTLEAVVFCWMLLPIVNAYFLARTGWFEASHALAALALSSLVTVVAAKTGGIASFAAIWFVAVPLEAALAGSRRAVIAAACFALAATLTLAHLQTGGLLPASQTAEADRTFFTGLGILSCALYATAVAVRAGSVMQIGSRLLSVGDARYHLLARNMTDVITRHGRNGAVLFASPAAESLFAVPPRDLIGHGLFDRVHVADRPAYLTALSEAAMSEDARSVEFRVRRDPADQVGQPRPHFIWVEMRCRPLDQSGPQAAGNAGDARERRDDDGREVVAVMRDITDRKAQEQAVEDARREAERANAAKSRFLATVTHELRTPLNAVIGFSDMLMHEEAMKLDAVRRRDYAQLINESGQHLLSVVNDILDVSKIETGNFAITPEPFAPTPTLKTCCDILALKARDAGVDLILRAGDRLPEVVADKRAFKQILLNLLSNAVKFTDRGGRVTVGAKSDASGFVLTVEDTGVGIDAADLGRIGDPFFQARGSYTRPYDGTGLGLSIVKGLVSLHGGSIDIQSRVGEGTCITVRLPLDCETTRRDEVVKRQPVAELPVIRSQPEHQVRKSA